MSAQTAQQIKQLTPREQEVFEDLVAGHSNKEIGRKRNISHRTVETHRARVMRKMQAQNMPHLVRMALEIGKGAEQSNSIATQTAQQIKQLTPREQEVFEDLVAGHSNKEISRKLNISCRTVEVHRARVVKKMQAKSLSHLVLMAFAIESEV
jgi:FixJ family two-component response regulator